MKLGYIILCRFNSSRLPGKILRHVGNKPLIQILLERLAPLGRENIIVATSVEPTDDIIAEYCEANSVNFFRGSLNDVAGRFLAAANHYGLDYAVRINGDNLFADAGLIQSLSEEAVSGKYDFLSNVPERTFPTGMSIEVVNVSFFKKVYQLLPDDKYKEHVTLYLYDNLDICNAFKFVRNNELPEAQGVKMAIDTQEDLDKAEKIVAYLGDRYKSAGWMEIINIKLQSV